MEGVGGAGEGADADAFVDWGDAEFGWGVGGDQPREVLHIVLMRDWHDTIGSTSCLFLTAIV